MKDLYFLQYNNYYNRIIKPPLQTASEYLVPGVKYSAFSNINFVPNDGVDTSQVVNWNQNWTPDYLLIVNPQTGNVEQRWFVIDMTRTCNGQYSSTLRRDLLADNYESVLDAPIYVEKAYINPSNPEEPAVFNKEGFGFNQIKKKETLIKGNVDGPWLVMYLKDKPEGVDSTINFSTSEIVYDYILSSLPPTSFNIIDEKTIFTYAPGYTINKRVYNNCLNYLPAYTAPWAGTGDRPFMSLELTESALSQYGEQAQYWVSDFNNAIGYVEDTDYRYLDGKTIYVNGALYKCSVSISSNYETHNVVNAGALFEDVKAFFRERNLLYPNPSTYYCELIHKGTTYSVSYEQLSDTYTYHTTINQSPHFKVNNQPYYMICAPLTDKVNIEKVGTGIEYKGDSSIALGLYKELSKTTEWLVDAQIVPYCPIEKFRDINLPDESDILLPNDYPCLDVYKGEGNTDLVIKVPFVLEDSFTIEKRFTIDVDNYKVSNECDMYRIVSPNYNGAFEFSAAKNFGVDKFIIRCTYKPISPLISVAPNFKGLYGSDFKDNRGLICQGSFQLGRESDEFKEYEYRNKNYQNAFNSQIALLDKQNYYQGLQEGINALVGTIGATAVGAKMGGVAGATIGALGGAATGIADVAINKKLREANKGLMIEQHQFQLGNIQALSYTVSNISNIDVLSKFYPFLEYYTCTDVERNNLINYLEYNSYTINRIGRISDFKQNENKFFRGSLIRLENTNNEYHEVNEIAKELAEGVFI